MAVAELDPGLTTGYAPEGLPQVYEANIHVGREDSHFQVFFPDKVAYSGLAIFGSGYQATEATSLPMGHALADANLATAIYKPVRRSGQWPHQKAANPQQVHAETLEAITENLLNFSEQIKNDHPNSQAVNFELPQIVVAHSMKGLSALLYAFRNPGRVDYIHNLAAVGYGVKMWEDVILHPPTLAEAAACGIHEVAPIAVGGEIELGWHGLFNQIRHALASPAQTLAEGADCLRHTVDSHLLPVKQAGTLISYTAFGHDIVVRPHKRVEKHVDSYSVMHNAGHGAPQGKAAEVVRHIVRHQAKLELINAQRAA